MSITVNKAATSLAVTGGTAQTFTDDNQTVQNGRHYADISTTDFRVRPHVTLKNRNPQRQSDGSYSKGKREIIYTQPILKANGTVAFNTWRYSQELDAETSAADEKSGRLILAQFLTDSEMDGFNTSGAAPA